MDSYKVLRGGYLIDGVRNKPINNTLIIIKNDRILEVGDENEVDIPKEVNVKEINLEDKYILPGLVDSHLHLALGRGENYEDMMNESDGIHLMTGIINSKEALYAGITTIKEAGARNKVAFDLREGWRTGLFEAPRLLISGRPLTITGGHFHFCNDNECDGVVEVQKKVRQFVHEGVDLIKIMASGGGTKGTKSSQASFNEDEIRSAVVEAHKFNRTIIAHCEAYDSVGNAARAGVDVLEHCGFILRDGTRGFDKEAVEVMAKKKIFYNPTLQTGSNILDRLISKKGAGKSLSQEERQKLEELEYKLSRKSENLNRIVKMGVQIIAGSDGIGLGNSTRLIRTLELMVDAGMSSKDAIKSSTSNAAKILKMEREFGSIKKGLKADIIAVQENPLKNISNLRKIETIIQNGNIIKNNEKGKK